MPSSGFQTCALRSEEHTSELHSHDNLVCRLLVERKNACTILPPQQRAELDGAAATSVVHQPRRLFAPHADTPAGPQVQPALNERQVFFFKTGQAPEFYPLPPPHPLSV